MRAFVAVLAGASATLALSSCAPAQLHMVDDHGVAVRQDLAAQIADPEPKYVGEENPGSNGAYTSVAQTRYERRQVTRPVPPGTTQITGGAASAASTR